MHPGVPPEDPAVYNATEIAELTGCTVHQLRHWHDVGLVPATGGRLRPGTGHSRLWYRGDVLVIHVVAALANLGVSSREMQRAFTEIRRHHPETRLAAILEGKVVLAVRGGPVVAAIPTETFDTLTSALPDLGVVRPYAASGA